MKVAKKVRLLAKDKDGFYIKNETQAVVMRTRAVVSQDVITDTEYNYKETGILYIVDEQATAERNEAKANKGKKPVKQIEVDSTEVLVFDGVEITEDNIDQFAEDNGIKFGVTKDPQKKLNEVKEFINKQ